MPHRLERRTAVAFLVAATFFMENLDATVITTSLPVMARDFHTAPAYLSIGVSAYLVALTMFIPVSGWLAERFGARRVFASAITVFTVASLLCALSTGLFAFTAARVLQGLGGAMMVPVGRLVVLRDTPKHEIVRAIAILTWPALVAPILGPPLGGWISTHWSWPWIFLLNLPLGVAAFAAALCLMRDTERQARRFDTSGFVLSGLGFACLMSGIEMASRADVSVPVSAGTCAAGVALLAAAIAHLRRVPHPLFDLAPLKITTFRVTVFGGSLFRTAISTAPFLLPLMFQVAFGWSAVASGALLLWLFAGNLCMKPGTTWIMQRFGFRTVLVVNGTLVALGFAGFTLLGPDTPRVAVAALLFFSGLTRSMQFTALNTIGFADVPQPQMRDATTLFSVLQQMNGGMGIAVGALALSVAEALRGTHAGTAGAADFHLAFWMITALAALGVVDSVLLPRSAGAHILARR
ncbi:MDR family MFS transporter [Paraburkholderia unamae]|uniref:EmrB/QacA subfamily drug resistance transporter n=1 Tax=Paraburkholderia unamae TaxID=219649 RepID=A0ABX5KR35_9BURK|nr:MDR family MFS transporter [Paraburkholderia unamae]PVX85019.1 EmrB/QacA subfamily drug resistance transporter [Paraburkholderia unamae]CAG9266930.1 EmrB/QacA subfamily drug resistance transporter [Paraburkholderia unamae]